MSHHTFPSPTTSFAVSGAGPAGFQRTISNTPVPPTPAPTRPLPDLPDEPTPTPMPADPPMPNPGDPVG